MSNEAGFVDEQGVMRRLLVQIMAASESYLAEGWSQSHALAPAAAATYFLLDPEPGSGVKRFVTEALERLVQQLGRSTQQRQVECRGQVRGRIAWPATFKARYAQDYDPTRFVCREVRHQYDTPENQLLRYMVERIHHCLELVPPALQDGACCYGYGSGDLNPQSTELELRAIETVLSRLRRNVRLREITLPEQITELHLLRAKMSRMEGYIEVARLHEQYQTIVETLSWQALVDTSQRVLLLPAAPGPAGDPWIRLGADMLRKQPLIAEEPVSGGVFREQPEPVPRQHRAPAAKPPRARAMAGKVLHFNGIRETGMPLISPKTEQEWVEWILSEARNEPTDHRNVMRTTWEKLRGEVMGVIAGVDAQDLDQAGWGIIYPEGIPDEIKNELADLVTHRKGKELIYRPSTSYWHFRNQHGQGPGDVNPALLPYYLLIVGSPEEIPFSFQYGMGTQHAVGRLYFEDVEDYGRYARRVVEYEGASGSLPRERRVAFFSTSNPDDEATARSNEYLVEPLASKLQGKELRTIDGKAIRTAGQPLCYKAEHVRGGAAKKETLLDLLTRESDPPALLFTASHGLGFPSGHERQKREQGGLICAGWPGPKNWPEDKTLEESMYLSGRHLNPDARFDDLFVFSFACYSAGTPHLKDFGHFDYYSPEELSPQPFVAYLPQRLLAQGALVFIGHVDRVWDYSFLWNNVDDHTDTFRSALEAILTGVPVGHAFEYFRRRYLDLNDYLTGSHEGSLINQLCGGRVDVLDMASTWAARNDARAYVICGDPAVRLGWQKMSAAS